MTSFLRALFADDDLLRDHGSADDFEAALAKELEGLNFENDEHDFVSVSNEDMTGKSFVKVVS